MMQISETEAFRACRVLFGNELRLSREFLQYLQPSGAHSAFRRKAKITHPDSCHASQYTPPQSVRLFQDLNQAHQLLQSYLRQRDMLSSRNRSVPVSGTSHSPHSAYREQPHARPAQGPLPTRPLQFGTFLFYRGLLPYKTLIAALTWQRQQRPAFGQIARRWGWLGEEEISHILFCRLGGRFGERAEKLGLLSPIQVRAILLHQRTRQQKLGNFFIEQGLFSPAEIEILVDELSEHNLKYRHGHPHHFYYHR